MRFRRLIAVALLLGAIFVVVPSSLSASPSSSWRKAPPMLRVLDEVWHSVGRLLGWLSGASPDTGMSPDPNG
jgi:hypothetical protein